MSTFLHNNTQFHSSTVLYRSNADQSPHSWWSLLMQYTFIDPFSRTNYDFEGIHQGQGPSRSAILDRHEPQSWMNPRKADMQLRFFPRVISTFVWLRSLSTSWFRFLILFLYHLYVHEPWSPLNQPRGRLKSTRWCSLLVYFQCSFSPSRSAIRYWVSYLNRKMTPQ